MRGGHLGVLTAIQGALEGLEGQEYGWVARLVFLQASGKVACSQCDGVALGADAAVLGDDAREVIALDPELFLGRSHCLLGLSEGNMGEKE